MDKRPDVREEEHPVMNQNFLTVELSNTKHEGNKDKETASDDDLEHNVTGRCGEMIVTLTIG